MVNELIKITDRADGNQSNLRITAYEALMELIKHSPKDCYSAVRNTTVVILKVLSPMGVTGLCPSSKVSSDDGPADDVPPTNQPNQQGNAPGPSAVVPVAPAPVEEAQEPVEEVVAPVEEVPVEEVHEPVDQDAAQPVEEHVPEDPVPRQPPVAPAQRVVRQAQYFHALFPTTIRRILAYFVLFNVGLGLLGLPWFSIYIGLSGLCLCFFTCFHVYKKNDRMMFPFYLYVLFTIFYLLFLGGYFFFVNIFHKEMVKEALGDHSDSISFIWHFADIVLIMTHACVLSVTSKCRKYFQWVAEGGQKVELPTTSTAPRHESKPDIF
ncbi:hypothetical protein CRE_23223 [Caenorhabditis remanei]|uniref:Importin subunit beta-1/Transportin-1-like TPR repeats domain-containing protein n=1 Tax=Caenorhabditis remanei TaxID=31234 RepID=E3NP83_CAERE|nr:hypothetical protein CRE_23223 [Caenorhabditis remanei]